MKIKENMKRILPNSLYLKLTYYKRLGKKLNLKSPQTFNEKLQWLKLYNRKPEYTKMVDKYEAKQYVEKIIGKEYIIPTLGIWNKFEDIDFDKLPNQFVLKCTHDSGGVIICKDKKEFEKDKAREEINICLKANYFYRSREWPYKNVKPRIIAEQYMEDNKSKELRDYKFFCFNGKVKCFKIDFDRFLQHRANYYDTSLKILPFGEAICPPDYNRNLEIPEQINKMIMLAEKLSKDIPFLRVDFYEVNGKIYFGELTFFPASGLGKFTNEEWDKTLGSWIELPKGRIEEKNEK